MVLAYDTDLSDFLPFVKCCKTDMCIHITSNLIVKEIQRAKTLNNSRLMVWYGSKFLTIWKLNSCDKMYLYHNQQVYHQTTT